MEKRVIMEVDDFQKIVAFVIKQQVPFKSIAEAAEVKAAIERAQVVETETIQKKEE